VVETIAKATGANSKASDDASEDETGEAEESENAAKKTVKAAPRKRPAETEVVEKTTARDLYDYVLAQGRKEYIVQRYKGLGEMTLRLGNHHDLTPHPALGETRRHRRVRTIFTTLMGEDVEARRKFIEDNALDVKNGYLGTSTTPARRTTGRAAPTSRQGGFRLERRADLAGAPVPASR